MPTLRIAIGGFQHETNTFSDTATRWQDFAAADTWPGLVSGAALLTEMAPPADIDAAPRNIPIAGFIAAAHRYQSPAQAEATTPTLPITLAPLSWCAAGPSGRVDADAFERVAGLLTDGLAQLQADAVYLDLHGAMAAAHIDDADGELLRRVRAAIGAHVPLIVSLDLHANVSPLMLQSADMLIAYRTYPHVDMAATGARAFDWLMRRLQGEPRLPVAWRSLPFLIPLCWQCTDDAPAHALYADHTELERGPAPSVSFAMGFPCADVEKCAPMVWAYGLSQADADAAVQQMSNAVTAAEGDFAGEILTPAAAVARARDLVATRGGPVVIADAQDNPGAGGSADTTALLRALIDAKVERAVLGLLVDPAAATLAHRHGVGARLSLQLGGKSGIAGDAPLAGEFVVERLHDGDVTASGSVFRGYRLTLGASACLRINGVRVIVVSKPVQLLDLALLRFMDIEPERESILIVKSTVHFRADFAPIASAILVCAAAGAYRLDPRELPWTRLPPYVRRGPQATP